MTRKCHRNGCIYDSESKLKWPIKLANTFNSCLRQYVYVRILHILSSVLSLKAYNNTYIKLLMYLLKLTSEGLSSNGDLSYLTSYLKYLTA